MEQLQPYEEALKERGSAVGRVSVWQQGMIPFEESFDDDTVEEGWKTFEEHRGTYSSH